MKLLKLCAIVLALQVSSSFAGVGSSGGGDIVHCKKRSHKGIHLADTFELKKRGFLLKQTGLSEKYFYESYIDVLSQKDASLAGAIAKKLEELQFIPVKKVKELNDDNLEISDSGCRKKQLAIQDLEAGIVEYNESYYEALSIEEKVLFKFHEAFIALKKTPQMNDTTSIREEVSSIRSFGSYKEFLVKVILKNRIFPDFKWHAVIDQIVDLWMGSFLLKFTDKSYPDFCAANKDSLDVILSHIKTGNRSETLMNAIALMDTMKAFNYEANFRHANPLVLIGLLEKTSSVLEMGLGMYDSFSVPRWIPVDQIDLNKMQKKINDHFELCPNYLPYKNRIQTEFEEYKQQISKLK